MKNNQLFFQPEFSMLQGPTVNTKTFQGGERRVIRRLLHALSHSVIRVSRGDLWGDMAPEEVRAHVKAG